MKFEIRAGDLASAAAYAHAAMVAKPVQDVLACMKITATEAGTVTLTGGDGDTTAVAEEPAAVGEHGTVIIPGKLFADITKGLDDDAQATLTAAGTTATLEYGTGKYELVTLDASLYPEPPVPAQPAGHAAADLLAMAISRTTIAVSRDDAVVALTAIEMILEDDRITLNSTDRYCGAQAYLLWSAAGSVQDIRPALVPGRHLVALIKTVPPEKNVSIGISDGMVTFAGPGRALTCRLIGGEFPGINKQFERFANASATAVVDRKALQAAVTRVTAVADRLTPVKLEFTPGQVRVSAGGGRGTGGEVIRAELDGEDQMWPGFRPEYLREVLEAAGTQKVAITFTVPRMPVLITDGAGEGARDNSFRFVLMPQLDVRAQEEKA